MGAQPPFSDALVREVGGSYPRPAQLRPPSTEFMDGKCNWLHFDSTLGPCHIYPPPPQKLSCSRVELEQVTAA